MSGVGNDRSLMDGPEIFSDGMDARHSKDSVPKHGFDMAVDRVGSVCRSRIVRLHPRSDRPNRTGTEESALDSPQWHRRQNAIQRDVEDITFLLDRALKASQNLNDAARNDYAEQALRLLQRAVRRGHFDPKDIEPVLTVIRQLLSNVAA